jgi:ADP-ribose pyrophosphatase YjhB (NUDIX family)
VRVSALIVLDGRVVLVRHRAGTSAYHLLPGGGVGYRETLEDAVVREVREETGLEVGVDGLLFVNDTIDPSGPRHIVNMTFSAHVTGGEITDCPQDARVEAVDLMGPASLASLDLRPPMAAVLCEALEGGPTEARYLGSLFGEAR